MKFKARMTNDQLSILSSVVGPISKLQDHHNSSGGGSSGSIYHHPHQFGVLQFDEDFVRICCKSTHVHSGGNSGSYSQQPSSSSSSSSLAGIAGFAELSKTQLFVDYRIESKARNTILLQLDLVAFKLALQSVVQSNNNTNNNSNHHHYYPNNKRRRYNNNNNNDNNDINRPSSSSSSSVVTLKLAKRNNIPCLCLEGSTIRGGGGTTGHDDDNGDTTSSRRSTSNNHNNNNSGLEIHQAIPVRILRTEEVSQFLPPQDVTTPQVQLELPLPSNSASNNTLINRRRQPIRLVIDRFKNLGKHVILEGNMEGNLTVRLHNQGASMACYYDNLNPVWPPKDNDDDDNDNDNDNDNNNNQSSSAVDAECRLKVDAYKLSTCLQWQQHQHHMPISRCLLSMVQNERLMLNVFLGPEEMGFFTFYMPVQLLDEEDEY